jgi:DNA replication protein DnaC
MDAASCLGLAAGCTKPADLICPKHGAYKGWTMVIMGQLIESECNECAKMDSRIKSYEKTKQYKEYANQEMLKKSCIPPRFASNSMKGWQVRCKLAEEIRNEMAKFINNFDEAKKNGTSFLFVGETGVGKTHMATAVANNLMMKGHSVIYISSLNFISRMKRAWTASAVESEDEIIEGFMPFDLLVIDELGKGTLDAKERGMIFRLIDRRHEENKPMIGISRYPERKLGELIEPDTIRRLKSGGGRTINFDWAAFE